MYQQTDIHLHSFSIKFSTSWLAMVWKANLKYCIHTEGRKEGLNVLLITKHRKHHFETAAWRLHNKQAYCSNVGIHYCADMKLQQSLSLRPLIKKVAIKWLRIIGLLCSCLYSLTIFYKVLFVESFAILASMVAGPQLGIQSICSMRATCPTGVQFHRNTNNITLQSVDS
jgi:hypothetical protein